MNSLLMTAENGHKTFDGLKTQTRRMLSAFDQTVLNDWVAAVTYKKVMG